MNRNRLIIGVVTAVVVALLLSVFVYREFKHVTAVSPVVVKHIVVAAKPLQIGARLDPNDLRLIPWPSGDPVSGMFTRVEDCANRALITPVTENEPILESKLAPLQAGAGLSAAIPEGMRALSVAVNEVVGVAGFVVPGKMVDVLVTGKLPGTNHGLDDNITRTILENVRVLAAGQQVEVDREGKPQKVTVITLLVSPADAAKLAMASNGGKIQLALRNTIDTKVVDPSPVLEAVLFAGAAPPPKRSLGKPAPPPQSAPYVVEILNGNKRESKSFSTP